MDTTEPKNIRLFILLIATLLSFLALGNARRFHPDEAFYMTIARNAAINGDWLLLAEPVDKPPLTFYINALALVFFANETDYNGVLQLDPLKGEFAGRIPSVLMSIVLVAVIMQIVRDISGNDETSYIAGVLTVLSPLRIAFAPTAFTDMPMLLFGAVSLWMAFRGRWGWAGVWFTLSLSAKPQIIFYLPLILILLIFHRYRTSNLKHIPLNIFYFIIPIIIGIGLLWAWDALRITNGAESFYFLGQSRYTTTTITVIRDYPTRFGAWWQTTRYLFGHTILTSSIIILALIRLVFSRKFTFYLFILWGWIFSFFAVHMVLTLNLFDRNQIILLPIVVIAVILTFSLDFSLSRHRNSIKLAMVFVGCMMLVFSIQAGRWQLPIGGDDGRHDGIDELANYLNSQPVATVIYDSWLDWELDYYMGQWTDKRRVFYPTPESLVMGALSLEEEGTRYFVAPRDRNVSHWLRALEVADFSVTLDYEQDNFIVYSLVPPS